MTTTTTSSGLRTLSSGLRTMLPGGIAALVLATVALLLGAAPASAHVGIASASTTDAVTTINFSFDHGCGSSPTIALEMQLPAAAEVVSTELMSGWVFDGTTGDGASTSQQVARISGPPIPDGQFATFTVVARGYDTSVDHLVPTVQLCEQGEEAWIDPDQASPQSAPFLAATTAEPPAPPAPEPTLAPAADPLPVAEPPEPLTAADEADADRDAAADAEADASGAPWVAIIAGVIGGAATVAVVQVARSRRKAASS